MSINLRITCVIVFAGFTLFLVEPSLFGALTAISGVILFGFQTYLETDLKTEAKKLHQEIQDLKNKIDAVNLGRMLNR